MRLGSYACRLTPDSLAFRLYGADIIHERHRHRYEFNRQYEKTLTDAGLRIVGRSLDGKFVEIVELPESPVVRGGPVPPRVQVEAAPPASRCSPASSRPAYRRKLAATGVDDQRHRDRRAAGRTDVIGPAVRPGP